MSHLKENNITYYNHFKRSMIFSYKSLQASLCFFIHAIYPNIYEDTGSQIIIELSKIEF